MQRGIDIVTLKREDPARAWNVIYSILVEGTDKKGRKELDSDIFRRPPGENLKRGGDAYDQALMAGAADFIKNLERSQAAIDSSVEPDT